MSDLYNNPMGTAEAAAEKLAELTGKPGHHVSLVMGSGWVDAADSLGDPTHEFDAVELPGFLPQPLLDMVEKLGHMTSQVPMEL
jgi:purine-nucleoside phosphorylase